LGQQRSRQRGAGLEFDQLTEYASGGTVRRINWAATARRGSDTPLVNVYYEEQDFTVMLLVDLSASMDFGSTRLTKKTLSAEICASLVHSALVAHNRVGFLGFTSRLVCSLPPCQAKHYQWAIPERILACAADPAPVDFSTAATALERWVKSPALVFLLSDFLTDDLPQFERALTRVCRQHEIVALRVTDPLEMTFPSGTARLVTRDLETNRVQVYNLTRKNRQRMAAHAQAHATQLSSVLKRAGVPYLTVTPHSNYCDELSRLFLPGYRSAKA
jgi:uncharacterized protein (DUF58 family)